MSCFNLWKILSRKDKCKTSGSIDKNFNQQPSISETVGVVEFLPCPEKSPTDPKTYRVIRLPNGIIATIISQLENVKLGSDPEKNYSQNKNHSGHLAACSLTVQVGSFSDPDKIPGLAHLLEHVLTMGSDKYPMEDEFEVLLSRHGGTTSALTESEYTTYFFDCQEAIFSEALKMFSRFFIAPLLSWKSINKEINAVDAEFAEHLTNDNTRRLQLLCKCATENNPARKFSFGNRKTLQPNSKLLKSLREFKDTYYTGDKIKIAIQSRHDKDLVIRWVEESFSEVPTKNKNIDKIVWSIHELFHKSKFNMFYRMQSQRDKQELDINWLLSPVQYKYKTTPLHYLSYVLGAEGDGSLIAHLRQKHLALYLTAEVEDGSLCSNSLYTIFTLSVALVDTTDETINEIITNVFGYLKMLKDKGPSKIVYNELKSIFNIHLRYSKVTSTVDNVVGISQNMATLHPTDYVTGWTQCSLFNPKDIEDYLTELTPSRANIILQKGHHQHILNEQEFWFKIKYRADPIPPNWLEKWEEAEPQQLFNLPQLNPYIPTDFNLVKHQRTTKFPDKLLETNQVEIWHQVSQTNRAAITILINTPKMNQSAEEIVCQMLLNKMFTYRMINDLYFARVAQIECHLKIIDSGVELLINGFSQHLPKLLTSISGELVALQNSTESDWDLLEILKEDEKRNMTNVMTNNERLLQDIKKWLIVDPHITSREKYLAIKLITKERMVEFCRSIFKGVYVQALVRGNIGRKQAECMIMNFVNVLKMEPAESTKLRQVQVRCLPIGESIVSINNFSEDNICYCEVYYQYGPGSPMEWVALKVFVSLLEQPLFNQLRTKEQLGYTVSANVTEFGDIFGIVISAIFQSNRFAAEHVRNRVDEFVRQFCKTISGQLSMTRFQDWKIHYSDQEDFWREIKNRRYVFNRRELEMEALRVLDYKTICGVLDKLMCRKLVVEVGNISDLCSTITNTEVNYRFHVPPKMWKTFVTNILTWKSSMNSYSVNNNTEDHKIVSGRQQKGENFTAVQREQTTTWQA